LQSHKATAKEIKSISGVAICYAGCGKPPAVRGPGGHGMMGNPGGQRPRG